MRRCLLPVAGYLRAWLAGLEVREMASLSCNYVAITDVREAPGTHGSDLRLWLRNGLQPATLDFKAWPWRGEKQGFCRSEMVASLLALSRLSGQDIL